MKLTSVLFSLILLSVILTQDNQLNQEQQQTTNNQQPQEPNNTQDTQTQTESNVQDNNTSNQNPTEISTPQNNPEFIDQEVEDPSNKKLKNKYLKREEDNAKTTLVHEQNQDLSYQKDFKKNALLITQLNTPIELDKEYIARKSVTYRLTEDNTQEDMMLYVTSKRRQRYVKIIFIQEDNILAQILYDDNKDMQIPISADLLKQFKGGYIEFVPKRGLTNVYKLTQQKVINMDFGQSVNLKTILSDEIIFDIKASNKDQNDKQRYQFILQTDLDEVDLKGDESLDFYVNFNKENPTIKNYDFKASGNIGHGLIKTLNKNSEFFCKQEECHYRVLIVLSGIDKVNFFPSEFPNESVIKFQKNMHLIEELEQGEIVTYEIEVPKGNFSWIFRKIPTQEDIKFYVNPDQKPDSLDMYRYKGIEEGQEDLIITSQELRQTNQEMNKFYLTFESRSIQRAAVFEFKIYNIRSHTNHTMSLNTYQTGVINGNEIISYTIDLSSNQKATYSLNLQLYSYYGNSDLYIKSCNQQSSCRFQQRDLQKVNSDKQNNNLYRSSKQDIKQNDGTYLDQILLQFNCLAKEEEKELSYQNLLQQKIFKNTMNKNKQNQQQQNEFDNTYFTSETCKFVIAVKNRTVDENKKSMFKLIATGEGLKKNINLSESATVQQNENEETTFQLELTQEEINQNRFFKLEAISLTGACDIFVSTNTEEPNNSDNQGQIIFQDNFENNIHTFSKFISIPVDNISSKNKVFIRIVSKDFSIVEIIPQLQQKFNITNSERLKIDQVFTRQIRRNSIQRFNNKTYYYYNFYYVFEENPGSDEILEFTLNTEKNDVNICIQEQTRDIDFKQSCEFQSDMKLLEIDSINKRYKKGDQIAIGIFSEKKELQYEVLPLNFSLTMTVYKLDKKNEKIELFQPNVVFTKKMKSKDKLIFSLNFSQMKDYGFMALTTQNIGINADIYLQDNYEDRLSFPIETLNNTKFAYLISNNKQIRWNNEDQKKLFVIIKNSSDNESRFSFIYSYDQQPIQLVEGAGLYLPSNLEHFFMYKQKQNQTGVNINFASEQTQFETFAKVFGNNDIFASQMKTQTKTQSDYKTDVDNKSEIIIKDDYLKKFKKPIIFANYQPINNYQISRNNKTLSISDKLTVTFDNGIKQIYPFEYVKNTGFKGEYKYFQFIIDEPQNILVNLVIDSGESDLYISKGKEQPTRTNYWKRSATKKGDQIEISSKDFENESDMIGIYTVGVYSREYSQFELVFVPSQENFYHVKFQKILNLELQPNQDYYLQFHNKYESFTTMMYADQDIHVDVLDYNERNKFDFFTYILNEKNYTQHFEFTKGNPPRVKFLDDAGTNKEFFVIKIKSEKLSQFMFCIFDLEKPIEIYSEKRFDLSLDENQEVIFEVKLDGDYQMADVDIRLKFGDIQFAISDNQQELNEWETLNKPDQIYKELMMEQGEKQSDIIIFKRVFVKVKASQLSSFSILVKPKNKYKQLREFETEIIYTNPKSDQYFYYYLNQRDQNTTQSLVFNLHMIQTYEDKPELLFVAEDDFSLQGDNQFLPMPINSVVDQEFDETKSQIITTQVTSGYYVIMIKQNTVKIPIKIQVQINEQKSLDLNGLRKELQPLSQSNKHQYYMYIPEPGHFRIILESCKHITLDNAVFIEENTTENALNLEQDYFEAQNYAQITYKDSDQQIDHKQLQFQLYRGEVKEKGVLKFTITQDKSIIKNYKNKDLFYEIVTEFQPKRQELVLKDYIEVFSDNKTKEQTRFSYFFDQHKNLVISFDRPNFKPQLQNDLPKVQKIRMIFYLQLDGYKQNQNLRNLMDQCGLSSLNEIKGLNMTTERLVYLNDFSNNERIQFIINAKDMKQFSSFELLESFVTMKVHFIESEEDYFGISIDTKTVKLPYFEMLIPNSDKSSNIFRNILIFLAVSLLMYFMYEKISKRKQKHLTHQKLPTKKNNVELSKITTDPDQ